MRDQAESLRELVASRDKARREQLIGNRGRQKVIAVASGKGGVGKTTFSVNLAIAMHQKGKSVLLFDADLGLSNVNIVMGEIPKYNLFHVLKGERTLQEAVFKTKFGVDIIAGASGFHELANLAESDRHKFIEQLEVLSYYEYIVIDTGAGISKNVTSFLHASDKIIIVTTPEPTSVTDAYGIIKALASENNQLDVNLIVNKAISIAEGKKVSERILSIAKQFLKLDVNYMGIIYRDDAVEKALYKRSPFSVGDPKAKCAISVDAIASKLLNMPYRELTDGTSFSTFFKNLFT